MNTTPKHMIGKSAIILGMMVKGHRIMIKVNRRGM